MTVATAAEVCVREPVVLTAGQTVGEVRALFTRDHQRLALVVDASRRLVTTLTREDVVGLPDSAPARYAGSLEGRVVAPDTPVARVMDAMRAIGLRRVAVVEPDLTLVGLVCLKASGTGFCTDAGIRSRRRELAASDR